MSNTKFAISAVLQIGDLKIDCLQFEDGSYHFYINQLRDKLGIQANNTTGQKYLKPLMDNNPSSVHRATVVGYRTHVKTLSLDLVTQAIQVYAQIGNPRCIQFAIACMAEALQNRADRIFGREIDIDRSNADFNRRAPLFCSDTTRKERFKLLDSAIQMHAHKTLCKETQTWSNEAKLVTIYINEQVYGRKHFCCQRSKNMTQEQKNSIAELEFNILDAYVVSSYRRLWDIVHTEVARHLLIYGNLHSLTMASEVVETV